MKLSFRYAIAAIVMAGALFLLSPTLMPEDINLPGASRISLGLDLKGGVQLTLGVDTEKAVQSALINSGQVLRQKAREAGITVLGPRQMPGGVQELIIGPRQPGRCVPCPRQEGRPSSRARNAPYRVRRRGPPALLVHAGLR